LFQSLKTKYYLDMNKFLYFLSLFVVSSLGYSQVKSSWKEVGLSEKAISQKQENNLGQEEKRVYTLNEVEFKQSLESLHSRTSGTKSITIVIPNSLGKMEQFRVEESSNFAPELQAQYPEIRAYSGTGITDPNAYVSFSVSPSGIQTMVLRAGSGSEFIDPLVKHKSIYVISTSKSRSKGVLPLNCKTVDVALNKDLVKKTGKLKSNNGVFKTIRLALSCTGEYAQYFGGTTAKALAAMNATMTRVNGVFNKDLALKLEIIANNSVIIYTDPATDPYSNSTDGTNGAWNLELQSNLTSTIGNGSYDIGHLFGDSGGGGDAGCIGCVCVDPNPSDEYGKGSAYTSPSNGKPEGDSFDIDYVAHEMGHQLGANHTFSYDIEDTGVNVEPGSGSTIMGYAGITDYDVQKQSDDYFIYASILQIQNNLATKTCPVSLTLSNQTPTVNAGSDYTIPKSTAFVLNGTGSDPNGGAMTYTWEQNDSATSNETGSNSLAYAVKPKGPNFRSFLPGSATNRYFPAWSKVLAGQLSTSWESVSSVGRNLNFVFTGRDNAALGSGQTNSDAMLVTVDGNKGPFAVTSQNTSNLNWALGSSQTISWSVNGTGSLVGSANVNIKLSTDGGLTFSTFLATNTPNDGSQTITAPATVAKNARILIEPTGNIFYAVNSNPFAIGYSVTSSCNSYAFPSSYAIQESQSYTEKTIIVPDTGSEISDVNFEIGFTHAYLSDVQIEVVSPKGTVVKLFNGECGSTNSSLVLKYDDLGGQLSCGNNTLQTVVPAQPLSAFNGENPAGTWTLRARDIYTGDTGNVDSASIDICSQIFTLGVPVSQPLDASLIVSPNPSKGNFDIQFGSKPENGLVKVIIYDLLGNKIFQKEYENKLIFKEAIRLEVISSGVYIMTVSDNVRDDVFKIVIQ
jgi:subtilisin-like proprotein convertase family protein